MIMLPRTIRVIPATLVLICALGASAAQAQTLTGRYWNAPSATTIDVATAKAFMSSNAADGLFTAQQSTLEGPGYYTALDTDPAKNFLGNDGASFSGTDKGMSDGLFDMSGFLTVGQDDTYNFSTYSDDGSVMYIDGQKVVDNDGTHSPNTAFGSAFLAAGQHTLDIVYFNWDWNNGQGSASFGANFGGGTVSPVPEASSMTLFGLLAAAMACFVIRSRKRHPLA